MKLTFLGATDTVTGSKYLLEADNIKILIDCGLFQGYKKNRQRNWLPLPINPKDIHAVVLTHAHIDHTGYVPLLVKNGFTGKIYATSATQDLCKILLPDSGYLQEEEARIANEYGYSKHKPALPLYTKDDALNSLKLFKSLPFGKPFQLSSELSFTFSRAGHILGAAMVQFNYASTSILFSGDLGRPIDPIMQAPAIIEHTDYLVIESTYGNREHEKTSPLIQLEKIVNDTVSVGGSIVIPSFAVGRAQDILYYLYKLKSQNKIPNIPIYLDSPMAQSATDILHKHMNDHKLSKQECSSVCDIAEYVRTPDESKALNNIPYPVIIISASGMVTGGRILHHIKNLAPNHRNTIIFTGYQAGGTRGARILDGEKQIKIHGNFVPIKAKIKYLSNMSAHADASEILQWLQHFKSTPHKVFITHGEPAAADALRIQIESKLDWQCCLPDYLQTELL